MVQRLNVILTTSPELSDFRKRLRNMDSKVSTLYRSTCFILSLIVLRMVNRFSTLYIAHGATIPLLYSRYVCLHKHMSTPRIFFLSCELSRTLDLKDNRD